jgi:hypothetical protein
MTETSMVDMGFKAVILRLKDRRWWWLERDEREERSETADEGEMDRGVDICVDTTLSV